MTHVIELYEYLSTQAVMQASCGKVGDKIIFFVRMYSENARKNHIHINELYNLFSKTTKVNRSYFTDVISKTWEVIKDEHGLLVVCIECERDSPCCLL